MFGISLAIMLSAGAGAELVVDDSIPVVIAKMEEVGTVNLTRSSRARQKVVVERFFPRGGGRRAQEPEPFVPVNAIIGVDFRPMAGTDPKLVTALVRELKTLTHLQTVLLLGQDVPDDAIDALPEQVRVLQLFNTRVTDKGIANLKRFKKLQGFDYTGTLLTDAGMKDIGKLTQLQSLTIRDAKVTDKGVDGLAALENLRRITIENTAASRGAIERLNLTLPYLFLGDFRNI